jgi:hypothetical protein
MTLAGSEIKADGPMEFDDGKRAINTAVLKGGNVVIREEGPLTAHEVAAACLSVDIELRLSALTLLIASQRTSLPLGELELRILKETFHHSIKCSTSDQRQKLMRIVKAVVSRQSEASRIAMKDVISLEKKSAVLNNEMEEASLRGDTVAVAVLQNKLDGASCLISKARRDSSLIMEACDWLGALLVDNLYPGTVLERESSALELLAGVLDTAGPSPLMLPYILSAPVANVLLNTVCSGWDRTRRLAAELLMKFPKPLPSYESSEAVASLLERGCRMTSSIRQRESDAGSLLLRTLFSMYCVHLGWTSLYCLQPDQNNASFVLLQKPQAAISLFIPTETASRERCARACASFITCICQKLDSGLDSLEYLFRTAGIELKQKDTLEDDKTDVQWSGDLGSSDAGLCYGLLTTARYCIEEARTSGLMTDGPSASPADRFNSTAIWRTVVQRLLSLSRRGLEIAMTVVAESSSDVIFAPPPSAKGKEDFSARITASASSKGPVNSATCMSATYVNTNSLVGAAGGDDVDGDDEGSAGRSSVVQRAIVAAWLLVRESATLMAFLVKISPPPSDLSTVDSSSGKEPALSPSLSVGPRGAALNVPDAEILSMDEITAIGEITLDALGRLKHMGAISGKSAFILLIIDICHYNRVVFF